MAFPSTFADLQAAVVIRARLDPVNDLQKAKDWINRAYYRVVLDAELLVNVSDMPLTQDVYSYILPSQVGRIKMMVVTPYGQTAETTEQVPMLRVPLEDILTRRAQGQLQSQGGSYTTHFAVTGAQGLEVWPTPAAADLITMWYAAFPAPMSGDAEVPIIEEPYASDLLEYGALVYAGDLLGDPSMEDWRAAFQQTMGEYVAHLDAKGGTIPTQNHQWGSLRDTRQLYGAPGGW